MATGLPVLLSFTSTLKRTQSSPFFWKCWRSFASMEDVRAPVSSLIFREAFSGSSNPSSIQPKTLAGGCAVADVAAGDDITARRKAMAGTVE